jgi:glycosyltransferase involved in cell wall biosynthesis
MKANPDKPLVSILMPVFNGERFLQEAISSLEKQTCRAWELIAVLDGCSDTSELILRDQQDPRIRIITLPSRQGISRALNQGLAACRCELVARFDADDICMPERLETQIEVLRKRPSVAVLGSAAILIDQNSRAVGSRLVRTGTRRIRLGLLFRNQLIHPSVMFRRSIVVKAGGYDEQSDRLEDYVLWLRLLTLSEIDNLSKPLIAYRLHPGQFTQWSTLGNQPIQVLADSRSRALAHAGFPRLAARPLQALWLLGQARQKSALLRRASLGR